MRTTDAPEGLDTKSYNTRVIQILNAANEGQGLDGMVLNHITRYICRLNPSERTDLENQFMNKLQRVCLFTDLNDATQAAAITALASRKVGEPDPLPFYVNAVCRKPSNTWRPNEVRVMQNRSCPKLPSTVRIDVLSILPGPVTLELQYLVFLNSQQRVEPTGQREGPTALMYMFNPARDIDSLILQNNRGMRGVKLEGRLKGQVVCNVPIDHDELIAIVPLGTATQEGYQTAPRQSTVDAGPSPCLLFLALLLLMLAIWLYMKR